MKKIWIELLTSFATNGGMPLDVGAVLQWEEADALRIIERGYARLAKAPDARK